MDEGIETESLVRQLMLNASNNPSSMGRTLQESDRGAEVASRIERVKLRDRIARVPVHWKTKVETNPSNYTGFLRAAGVGALVSLHYSHHGCVNECRGIVESVADQAVTLTEVIEEWSHDPYKPLGIADACAARSLRVYYAEDVWLIERCCDAREKKAHLRSYADSPVVNIGRLVTLFTESISYTGVVEQVDSKTYAITLKNVLESDYRDLTTKLDRLLDTAKLDYFEALEWHERAEMSAHLTATTKVEQESKLRYMSSEQREAFVDFQSFFPTCRLHGSTVYGLSSPDADVDVCVPYIYACANFEPSQKGFKVIDDLLEERMPRIVLQHENGIEIDVVGMNLYEEEKDIVLSRICAVPEYREFFSSIRTLWKSFNLEPSQGYPNTFNMLLVGIFFLQLVGELPRWGDLASSEEDWQQRSRSFLQSRYSFPSDDLFSSYLQFLRDHACNTKMNLKTGVWKPKQRKQRPNGEWTGPHSWTWTLTDPTSTNEKDCFSGFTRDKIDEVIKYDVGPELDSRPPFDPVLTYS